MRVNLSDAMLKEARYKTANKGLPVRWIQGDMTESSLDQRFNLIILPSNNLCHLLSTEEVEKCLGCVKNHRTGFGKDSGKQLIVASAV